MEFVGTLREGLRLYLRNLDVFLFATLVFMVGSFFVVTFPPLLFGLFIVASKAAGGDRIAYGDVFGGFKFFVKSWAYTLTLLLFFAVGTILLVLPGLAVAFLSVYSIPLILNRGCGTIESIKESMKIGFKNIAETLTLTALLILVSMIPIAGLFLAIPLGTLFYTIACRDL